MQKLLVNDMKLFVIVERHGSIYERKLLVDRVKVSATALGPQWTYYGKFLAPARQLSVLRTRRVNTFIQKLLGSDRKLLYCAGKA